MKKYLALICVIALLSGCSTKLPYVNNTYFTDYRSFLKKGFFITESDAVAFDYDAIGHIEVDMCSGNEVVMKKTTAGLASKKPDSNGILTKKWGKYISVSLEDAMNEFYKQAKDQGADGALKLDIKPVIGERMVNGFLLQVPYGYKISGMLIKIRK